MEERKKAHPSLEKLIETGIPLSEVLFQRTVQNVQKGAETVLRSKGNRPDRVATLWYTPHGVVVYQFEKYSIIPLANCAYTWCE
jgi:hypothetical protein